MVNLEIASLTLTSLADVWAENKMAHSKAQQVENLLSTFEFKL